MDGLVVFWVLVVPLLAAALACAHQVLIDELRLCEERPDLSRLAAVVLITGCAFLAGITSVDILKTKSGGTEQDLGVALAFTSVGAVVSGLLGWGICSSLRSENRRFGLLTGFLGAGRSFILGASWMVPLLAAEAVLRGPNAFALDRPRLWLAYGAGTVLAAAVVGIVGGWLFCRQTKSSRKRLCREFGPLPSNAPFSRRAVRKRFFGK
jgi:hypothetical protein